MALEILKVGKFLTKPRRKQHLTQGDVANRLGISKWGNDECFMYVNLFDL